MPVLFFLIRCPIGFIFLFLLLVCPFKMDRPCSAGGPLTWEQPLSSVERLSPLNTLRPLSRAMGPQSKHRLEPEPRICCWSSRERPLLLAFPEHTQKRKFEELRILTRFHPGYYPPSAPGQCVDNPAAPERFMGRNVRVKMNRIPGGVLLSGELGSQGKAVSREFFFDSQREDLYARPSQ